MKVVFYQYAKCDTCRKAAKFLEKNGVEVDSRPIVDTPPSVAELKAMAGHVGDFRKLFNTSGEMYRELKLSEKLPGMSEGEALKLLASKGKLVKRPFVLWDRGGLVGFKEETWKKALGK